MPYIYFSLGANSGSREENILGAVDILKTVFPGLIQSKLYETPDFHGNDRPYINMVAGTETIMSEMALDSLFKKLELQFGRTEETRLRGDVPLDIDLVVYGENIVKPKDYQRYFFTKGFHELCSIRNLKISSDYI